MQEPRQKETEKIHQQEQTRPRRSSSLTRPASAAAARINAVAVDLLYMCDEHSIVTKADEKARFAMK